ncbi:hypothetical protein ZIOFF_064792 [Zingiber officinale]|uniref:Uncharacterized protein n=2 Tax=Zingiber officinale TaxID=94328 RepID=A0A8J5EWF4_ZINOF|nr:hypothetical protein ZIOFF_064792 [Zingiber officinale]
MLEGVLVDDEELRHSDAGEELDSREKLDHSEEKELKHTDLQMLESTNDSRTLERVLRRSKTRLSLLDTRLRPLDAAVEDTLRNAGEDALERMGRRRICTCFSALLRRRWGLEKKSRLAIDVLARRLIGVGEGEEEIMAAGFPFRSGGRQQQPPTTEAFFLYGGGRSRSDDMEGNVYTRGFELTWRQQQYSGFPHELPLAGSAAIDGDGGQSCQDCGNKAKKECAHLRCRICCMNRGFKCTTHIKSTWVPAARRRDRRQHQAAGCRTSKRTLKIVPSTTATTAVTTTFGATLDSEIFPPELNTEAMFRCVRVSPVDDADEEYAYQTTVRIAGHLFKGILYDHGAASDLPSSKLAREASTSSATLAATSTPELLDAYQTPLTALVADSSLPFFPQQQRPS